MAPMYYYEEELFMLIPALLSSVPSLLFGIGAFILGAIATYSIARRRGLRNCWLAWVPVLNCWILGSLSDQYRYVVKGENKSKRKLLLVLNILQAVLTTTIVILAGVLLMSTFLRSGRDMMNNFMGLGIAIAGVALPLVCVYLAYVVIRFMALYDVYRSMDPGNAVLFLVLSIFFGVTEPFFLFFSRNKDEGMPPRRQPEPEVVYEQAATEAYWEPDNKDYL